MFNLQLQKKIVFIVQKLLCNYKSIDGWGVPMLLLLRIPEA